MNDHTPNPPARRRGQARSALKPRPIRIEDYPPGTRTDLRIPVYQDALASPVPVPFVLIRGRHPGPVAGISAVIHGDELNGIKIIHHILERADPQLMRGSLLCAPVVNVPAFQAGQRRFPEDDQDLNHMFPGKKEGTPSQQYARAFLTAFLKPLDLLIDIHTASEGRINSLYVRADLNMPQAREMALLMQPQIILHGRSGDGTLRNAARVKGVPAITVEAGNPSVFQGRMALEGEVGVFNILNAYGIVTLAEQEEPLELEREPVICKSSRWLRVRSGGLLETEFGLCDWVGKRQRLATIRDPFGHTVDEYLAPHDGVVIGMSRSPLAVPGTRYCHLGVAGEPDRKRSRGDESDPPGG